MQIDIPAPLATLPNASTRIIRFRTEFVRFRTEFIRFRTEFIRFRTEINIPASTASTS